MKFIKHKNMKDVCFQVYEEATRLPWQSQKVRGCWINIALGEPFVIGDNRGPAIETITIKDPENWTTYADPRAAKTRS